MIERGERILDALYDEAHAKLNPNDDACWHCGGDGDVFECFDGFCADAEIGCEDCTRACPECRLFNGRIERHVRLQILHMLDVDTALVWLEKRNNVVADDPHDPEVRRFVLANLYAGRCAEPTFSDDERATAACFVEGLL